MPVERLDAVGHRRLALLLGKLLEHPNAKLRSDVLQRITVSRQSPSDEGPYPRNTDGSTRAWSITGWCAPAVFGGTARLMAAMEPEPRLRAPAAAQVAKKEALSTAPTSPILLELPEAGEFTRMALWMVGSIAGLSTPMHALLRRHFQGMAKRLGWPVNRASSLGQRRRKADRLPDPEAAITLLADALVGTSRTAIASVFGPPRCAVAADNSVLAGDDVWRGRVWYYPIQHVANDAVAIEFDDEQQARRVMFVGLSV